MTGRTHDLAAFTSLIAVLVLMPQPPAMNLATALVAFGANFLGGLFPDIDQPSSDFWDNFRLGPFVAKVVCPALGGHRNLSHSIVGVVLIGSGAHFLLQFVMKFITIEIDQTIVWTAFMIGVISHILTDMPTKAGVPLFWPADMNIGIPPVRALRFESGKFIEKFVVFPGLLVAAGTLVLANQEKVALFLSQFIGR